MWIQGTDSDFVLTVSVGVTTFRPGERVEDALNRADRALYKAKVAGRDRVVIGTERQESLGIAETV
jgi:PleD family two-component response regulator